MLKSATLGKFASVCLTLGSIVGFSATAHANQFQLSFNIAAGGTSALITVPGSNTPVSVSCVQNTAGNRGVGQATVLRVSPAAFLEWVGMDIATSGTPSTGFSSSAGTHIIFCDFISTVDLQVANATQMRVKNTGAGVAAVVINFVY